MKKFYPYILPTIALIFVGFLAFRWYSLRTQRGDISQVGEGVEIENLSEVEAEKILKGAGDFKKVDLAGTLGFLGLVRYAIEDGKVQFSVSADVPSTDEASEMEDGATYRVWLKRSGAEDNEATQAFILVRGKGGLVGSAAVSVEEMPFEVIVTKTEPGQSGMGEVVLRGTVNQD